MTEATVVKKVRGNVFSLLKGFGLGVLCWFLIKSATLLYCWMFFFILFNWDSLHARLHSHC